jgi:hypothetical protein
VNSISLKKGHPFSLFIIIALLTEFYYIQVLGGALRPYHIIAPFAVLVGSVRLPKLFAAPLFHILIGLVIVNVVSATLANDPTKALLSLGLLVANVTLAVAVAILLISRKISERQAIMAFVFVACLSVVWTIVQIIAFRLTEINLGLSEAQQMQIAAGFGPGFRTEANTFAKFLNVAFLLTLPWLIRKFRGIKLVSVMSLISIGLLLAFTRSVFYTLPITLVLIYLWYNKTGNGRPLNKRSFVLAGVFLAVVVIYTVLSDHFNPYATYKIANFFNPDEITSGNSSGFRLMLQAVMIDSIFESPKNFFLGTGWGQIYYYLDYADREMQAGGADVIVFMAYGGLFSALLWAAAVITAIRSAARMASAAPTSDERLFFQGVMFATLGLLITGMVSGSIVAPEYWIVFGLGIYASHRATALRRRRPLVRAC